MVKTAVETAAPVVKEGVKATVETVTPALQVRFRVLFWVRLLHGWCVCIAGVPAALLVWCTLHREAWCMGFCRLRFLSLENCISLLRPAIKRCGCRSNFVLLHSCN